jgi:hypothetical protein
MESGNVEIAGLLWAHKLSTKLKTKAYLNLMADTGWG